MLKIRNKETGKVMPCTRSSWDAINRWGRADKFEIVEGDVPVAPIATKRQVETVEVPPMPEIKDLPEVREIKEHKKRGPKKKAPNE